MLGHHPDERTSDLRGGGAGEAGETLIEVMATVILLGLAITLIISGIWTALAVSDQNQKASRVNLYLHDYAEQLKSPLGAYSYIECATPANGARPYPSYQGTLPTGYAVTVVGVTYLTANKNAGTGALQPMSGVCQVAGTFNRDPGIQRITIQAKTPNGVKSARAEQIDVYKRDQVCRNPYQNADGKPC